MLEQLIVILDLAPSSWKQATDITETLSALCIVINVYLTQSQMHSVLVYLAGNGTVDLLWESGPDQGNRFPLSRLSETVHAALNIQQSTLRSGLSMAIGTALCRINRFRVDRQGLKAHGRLLIVTPGSQADAGSQHIPLMNSAFCAQKLVLMPSSSSFFNLFKEIPIDVLRVGENEAPLLQQAAFLTGGIFQTTACASDSIHILLAYCASSQSLRACITRPDDGEIDFRASCYCHRRSVDQGHVCSVCLSVFCKFSPICPCCHSKFEFPARKR